MRYCGTASGALIRNCVRQRSVLTLQRPSAFADILTPTAWEARLRRDESCGIRSEACRLTTEKAVMTPYPFFGSAQPDDTDSGGTGQGSAARQAPSSFPEGAAASAQALEPHDLEAALQLLVERAQYITGATGAALALAQGTEMVCRASAGSCAPPVGARLQVRSGLTGESVSRKQLLRCDNAENDPRVNLETCRELGIASIVVLPLLSSKGEVRGLFELFSDHAYAFEERDLIALERMAELTRTALDLAEKAAIVIPPRVAGPASVVGEQIVPDNPGEAAASGARFETPIPSAELQIPISAQQPEVAVSGKSAVPEIERRLADAPAETSRPAIQNSVVETQLAAAAAEILAPQSSSVPESMRRVQKCSSCGFPVSEGRSLCVDCEEKQHREPGITEAMPAEYVPSFGMSEAAAPEEESWLANHVNLLAILVVILSIVVAVVVFR